MSKEDLEVVVQILARAIIERMKKEQSQRIGSTFSGEPPEKGLPASSL